MCLDCTGTLPLLSISLSFLRYMFSCRGFFDAKFCFFLITSFSVNSCNFGVSLEWVAQVFLSLLS